MSGKTVRVFAVSALLAAGDMHASAETPSESVTVTATKSREVLGNFTKAFARPAIVTGKIARWERRVCPVATGQNPTFVRFVTQRVKYVALAVGAPVNTDPSCTPNIEIIFTTTPQALLDSVRKNESGYLGYATSSVELDALATVTRPIQAWYTTETADLNGWRRVDDGMSLILGAAKIDPTQPEAHYARWNGNRIDDGIHSGFNHILIVADTTKLSGQTIVLLADYISMLSLTQLNSLDTCQQLPSIVNILAPGCTLAADGITEVDLAYLKAIYKMNAGRSLAMQQSDIAGAMVDTLTKAK